MTDYLPITKGDAITLQASASITGGRLVAVSGDNDVSTATAAVTNWVGVAGFGVAPGDNLTVHSAGVQHLAAAGAIAAGDLLVSANGGQVAAVTEPPEAQVVGVAITITSAGNRVRVRMTR